METFNSMNKTISVSVMIRKIVISVNFLTVIRSTHNTE